MTFAWLLLLALAAPLVAQETTDFEFVMRFTGSCVQVHINGTIEICTAKAHSQVKENMLLGNYASWTSRAVTFINGTVLETGAFTFGTHLARDHMLNYTSFGAAGHTFPMDNETMSFTLDGQIMAGTGAFEGAQGAISYSGHGMNDFSEFVAYVTIIANRGNGKQRLI